MTTTVCNNNNNNISKDLACKNRHANADDHDDDAAYDSATENTEISTLTAEEEEEEEEEESPPTATITLQEECDEFTANFFASLPSPEARDNTLSKLREAARRIKATELDDRARTLLTEAPDFTLPCQDGNRINLTQTLQSSGGPVVLSFFRGGWCPYCVLELKALQRHHQQMKACGATLIAVSPMHPKKTQLFLMQLAVRNKLTIDFLVLSDVKNVVANRFGLVHAVDPCIRGIYKRYGMDPTQHNSDDNSDDSWELPLPATYVIAPNHNRKIRYSFVDTDYTKRAEPQELLKVLKGPTRRVPQRTNGASLAGTKSDNSGLRKKSPKINNNKLRRSPKSCV